MHIIFTHERNPDLIADTEQKANTVVLIPSAGLGPIVIMQENPLNRDSRAGIEAAVVDLWTLSNCDTVLGSSGSTFAETAAWMGQCQYRTLEVG